MDEFWPALMRLHSAERSEMDWLRAAECSGVFYRERLALGDKFNIKVSFVYSREQIARFSPLSSVRILYVLLGLNDIQACEKDLGDQDNAIPSLYSKQ
jgi:hypothetical protein